MNYIYSSQISDKYDEYPEVTQDDLNRAVFRIGLKPVSSHKQRVTIHLDTALVEYFKDSGSVQSARNMYNRRQQG